MYFTDAIVLSKTDVGEADTLFSLYTKEYGKVRARAQGVKKEEAKLRGHLEVLNTARIGFVTTKQGERLIYAEAESVLPRVRNEFDSLRTALYFVSCVDHATLPGEPDSELWNHLSDSLHDLEENGTKGTTIDQFEVGLLARLGYGGTDDMSLLGLRLLRPV